MGGRRIGHFEGEHFWSRAGGVFDVERRGAGPRKYAGGSTERSELTSRRKKKGLSSRIISFERFTAGVKRIELGWK